MKKHVTVSILKGLNAAIVAIAGDSELWNRNAACPTFHAEQLNSVKLDNCFWGIEVRKLKIASRPIIHFEIKADAESVTELRYFKILQLLYCVVEFLFLRAIIENIAAA